MAHGHWNLVWFEEVESPIDFATSAKVHRGSTFLLTSCLLDLDELDEGFSEITMAEPSSDVMVDCCLCEFGSCLSKFDRCFNESDHGLSEFDRCLNEVDHQ
ncbi:hypothetical protein L6452_40340 [Arctium lappa]|uniref:Uncharacterized protein n=1 Tax=Arctium lappa TaxID=4217 RepID=A0ACB8XM75_ARCLA|nr:hypothetical protein L6452_40340 [Arctium lappa]